MKYQIQRGILLILVLCGINGCEGKSERNAPDPVVNRNAENAPIRLERKAAFDTSRQKLDMESISELDAVDRRLQTLFRMIDDRDLSGLEKMVYPGEGVHVDLKAHRTVAELKDELAEPEGYFQKFYLDSELLKKSTGDPSQMSLHEILNKNSRIFAEYYLEPGTTQIEVRFYLGSTPEESFRINNAVLIKRDGQWYFLQLL